MYSLVATHVMLAGCLVYGFGSCGTLAFGVSGGLYPKQQHATEGRGTSSSLNMAKGEELPAEAKRYYVRPDRVLDVLTSAPQLLLRLGSGALVDGYQGEDNRDATVCCLCTSNSSIISYDCKVRGASFDIMNILEAYCSTSWHVGMRVKRVGFAQRISAQNLIWAKCFAGSEHRYYKF